MLPQLGSASPSLAKGTAEKHPRRGSKRNSRVLGAVPSDFRTTDVLSPPPVYEPEHGTNNATRVKVRKSAQHEHLTHVASRKCITPCFANVQHPVEQGRQKKTKSAEVKHDCCGVTTQNVIYRGNCPTREATGETSMREASVLSTVMVSTPKSREGALNIYVLTQEVQKTDCPRVDC